MWPVIYALSPLLVNQSMDDFKATAHVSFEEGSKHEVTHTIIFKRARITHHLLKYEKL